MADKGGLSSDRIPHYRLVLSQTLLTDDVVQHDYSGSGTATDPYIVDWIPHDSRNPMNMAKGMKWANTIIMALGTLSVTFSSTSFSGSLPQIQDDLHTGEEISILSVSLFVLGFAIAPMTWAPLSEHFGRQRVYAITFALLTIFGAASIGSKNIQTLLVLRFMAGTFGSSSIVNSAGVIADMFVAKERGLAMMVYSSAPFVGPTIGPIAGGFVAQYGGWRWNDGMTVIFTGVLWILGMILVPETYTPYLLIQRAKKLEQDTGKKYVSKLERGKEEVKAMVTFRNAIARPWILLFFEAIVLLLSIYSAIGQPLWRLAENFFADHGTVYGIIYLIFTAFPIVFEDGRHWSQGVSGLSYVGVLVGQFLAMFFYVFLEVNYQKKIAANPGKAKPEGRLQPSMIGAVLLPVGLFWFAWTTYPHVHWIVSILGSSIFGFGQVLLYISLINYVVDAYTVYAASALAANAILRGLFAVAL